MHAIHLTLLFAGLYALLQCALTALVIKRRVQTGIKLMDGGDENLRRRIRAHGNFAETAPISLLLMAFLELSGLGSVWILSLGCGLLLGRVLNAYGLIVSDTQPKPLPTRLGGMALTLFVLSTEAALCLWFFFDKA